MKKYQWVAYGLDMFGFVIVEVEGKDEIDAHAKVLKQLKDNAIDFDALEPFDKSFVNRVGWLKD